jgi:hypothetical protein
MTTLPCYQTLLPYFVLWSLTFHIQHLAIATTTMAQPQTDTNNHSCYEHSLRGSARTCKLRLRVLWGPPRVSQVLHDVVADLKGSQIVYYHFHSLHIPGLEISNVSDPQQRLHQLHHISYQEHLPHQSQITETGAATSMIYL